MLPPNAKDDKLWQEPIVRFAQIFRRVSPRCSLEVYYESEKRSMARQEIPREELDELMKWAQSHLELEAPQELPIDLLHAARKFYGLPKGRILLTDQSLPLESQSVPD